MTQEMVIDNVRKRLGPLNSQAEQAVKEVLEILKLPRETTSLKAYEFDALCEKFGKFPFVFIDSRILMIEESLSWHNTIEYDDAYPTVAVTAHSSGWSGSFFKTPTRYSPGFRISPN